MPTPPTSPRREQVIEVSVEDVQYISDDSRFSVVRVSRNRVSPDTPEFVAVGDLGRVAPGETLRLRGRFTMHPRFGPRFSVDSFTPVMPSTEVGLVKYLGSGLIEGIGPALAQRLVDHFGTHTLDVITEQSAKLREVKGIGKSRAASIAEAVRERRAEAETMSFLRGLGLGPATAARILRRYEDDAARQVREDPYLVAEQVPGIGFRTADRIGQGLGIGRDDPRRAQGAVLHLLGKGADDGHVFLPLEALHEGARRLDVPLERVDQVLPPLALRGLIIDDEEAYYIPPLHRAERSAAKRFAALSVLRKDPDGIDAAVAAARASADLSETQFGAVTQSLRTGLMVLTGGPGTGKTTTIKAIVAAHLALGRRVALCAPTGRAAKRMFEATGHEAKTIHRTLEWNPATASFKRDEHDPIDAELVLVDEASMMDVRLADKFVASVAPSSTLVLVGDVDQLPPVGPGQVLRDIIDSGSCPVVRLTEVFRQAQRSAIVRGAHAILQGHMPTPTPAGTRGDGDLFIVRCRDGVVLQQKLLQLVARMRDVYGLDMSDMQVLSPMKSGPAGTIQLNELLQAKFNPAPGGSGAGDGKRSTYRPGDKVMQLKNDYERGVYNGDLGTVRRSQGGITYVMIDGREVQYKVEHLDNLTLAYASTVHKVQGSEFGGIVVVLHGSHHVLLSRALLYTAVTRAKRLVVLLGDDRAMAKAARNASSFDVHSRLAERIQARVAAPTS